MTRWTPILVAVLTAGSWAAAEPPAAADPMKLMLQLGQPGEHHAHMAKLVGKWSARGKFWVAPDQPPSESLGTMVIEPALNGRFLRSEYTGEYLGTPFHGLGYDGYDNLKRKHVGMWVDDMGTTMMTFEGTCSDGGKITTMHTTVDDPVSGAPMAMRTVATVVDARTLRYETFVALADGSEFKTMEIVYTRQ